MSITRWGVDGSDVYLYYVGNGVDSSEDGVECCECSVNDYFAFRVSTNEEMLSHLDQHRAKGHVVPDHAYAQLRADAERLRNEMQNKEVI